MSGDLIALVLLCAASVLFVAFAFRPPRCPSGGAHDWEPLRPTLGGWGVTTCRKCGEKEIG